VPASRRFGGANEGRWCDEVLTEIHVSPNHSVVFWAAVARRSYWALLWFNSGALGGDIGLLVSTKSYPPGDEADRRTEKGSACAAWQGVDVDYGWLAYWKGGGPATTFAKRAIPAGGGRIIWSFPASPGRYTGSNSRTFTGKLDNGGDHCGWSTAMGRIGTRLNYDDEVAGRTEGAGTVREQRFLAALCELAEKAGSGPMGGQSGCKSEGTPAR